MILRKIMINALCILTFSNEISAGNSLSKVTLDIGRSQK